VSTDTPVESFPALAALPGVIHGFTGRVPGIDVAVDRESALARLEKSHADVREAIGLGSRIFITAQQVHGADVAVVDAQTSAPVPGVDGLITSDPRVCLGIYVADCGAVFLVAPEKRVIGLLHSGRKGTELGITRVAIERIVSEFGCDPRKMIVQLAPCIRPPHYEIDFAADIVRQARDAGVREVHDCGICTGQNVERYYSYRMERGRTGRMLAKLALA
jgi:purine-nucleoside/S-methyl-5'-thioadenosine phosphorylase / adenosine deaminase